MRDCSRLLSVLIVFLIPLGIRAQFYQGSNMEFGKNRVQHKSFTWFYYPGEHFDVFYYIGGEQLAQYVLISCENNLPQLEQFFNYKMEDRLQVLSYLNQSEFRQSNIGVTGDDQYNIGGSTKIVGNKMFTYFEGDHQKFEKQIRENLSRVLFNQMMFGGDWKDVLRNNTLLSIPNWYQEGIIAYAAQGNTPESELFIRDLLRYGKFKSLNQFEGEQARLIGQAFWSYIDEVYGNTVLPNILYMAEAGRSIESGFLYILGVSLEELSNDFIRFYQEKNTGNREKLPLEMSAPNPEDKASIKSWKKEQKKMGDLPVRYKSKYNYSQFELSPDGNKIVYTTNEKGQYRIWIYDFESKRNTCILKREYRLERVVDNTFPVLAWHPSGKTLTYTFERRNNPWLGHYSLETKKHTEKELFRLEKILDMHYSKDGKKVVLSAVNRGQSDLYIYHIIGSNQEQLTNDIWDDLHPRFVDDDKRIIFSSNRADDTLRSKIAIDTYQTKKDIFLYDIESRSPILERLTNTPEADEDFASLYGNKHYSYLSDKTGHTNRYLSTIDSTISAIDTTIHYRYYTTTQSLTNYKRNVYSYEMNSSTGDYSLFFYKGLQPWVLRSNKTADNLAGELKESTHTEKTPTANNYYPDILLLSQDTIYKGKIDIYNYVFEDEKKNYILEKEAVKMQEVTSKDSLPSSDTNIASSLFQLPASRNYRLNFATDYVVTQLNNSFSTQFYQNVTGPSSITPGISAFTKFGASDLFEDYKLVGGFRLSIDLRSIDFAASFEDLHSRWDKKYTFLRQSSRTEEGTLGTAVYRNLTNMFVYQLKYPFTETMSLRISGIGRSDRKIRQSNELASLMTKSTTQFNIGTKLEFVFDNTIAKGLNLFNGTRGKVWIERYQQPEEWKRRTDVNVFGLDFRHYERIHRDIIFASRIAGATTFGYKSIVHYLGGVDNWMFQKVDNSFPSADTSRYAYQAFAGPVRGFYVNSRSGNNVVMASAEVRLPVFKYFMKKPIKSEFIENFQIVTFMDAGSAWTGKNPYSEENVFNKTILERKPITLTIENNREPIVYGYGFGIRSRLLGYFVRADWAWGVDDGVVLPRVFYLSLNLDF